jgi:hypothetical protein
MKKNLSRRTQADQKKTFSEVYTGSHAFRVNYAQRRYDELCEKGLSKKDALEILSNELGHNRISVAKGYVNR